MAIPPPRGGRRQTRPWQWQLASKINGWAGAADAKATTAARPVPFCGPSAVAGQPPASLVSRADCGAAAAPSGAPGPGLVLGPAPAAGIALSCWGRGA